MGNSFSIKMVKSHNFTGINAFTQNPKKLIMSPLIFVEEHKNGKKKITFSLDVLYRTLKFKFGYRYVKIGGKGHYLKKTVEGYEVVSFYDLPHTFLDFLRTPLHEYGVPPEIQSRELVELFLTKNPIKNGNLAKILLREEFQISDKDKHILLMQTNQKYRENFKKEEVLTFLEREEFTESIDTTGNFSQNSALFYKRLSRNTFLIFNTLGPLKKGLSLIHI